MNVSRLVEFFVAISIPDKIRYALNSCILLSCHDVDRGLAVAGQYFSPILSPIGEYYKGKGKKIVNLSHPLTSYKTHQVFGGAISINRSYLRHRALERIDSVFLGKQKALERKQMRLAGVYSNTLRKLKPSLIFSIQPPAELCIAAHAMGIAVVEAMHGMNFHPRNKIFRSWIEGVDDQRLPSAYLAFDDRTFASLSQLTSGRPIHVLNTPHPWHVEVNRRGSRLVGDDKSLRSRLATYRASFLITLQWGYDGERDSVSRIIPNGIMHPSLEAAIGCCPTDILWLVRLHPVQMKRRRYSKHRRYVERLALRFPNFEWRLASTLPLPALLSVCHGHITMSSGSAGEAALVGVPSLMLCPTLRQGGAHEGLFEELVESGVLKLGKLDTAEICNWISDHSSRVNRLPMARNERMQELHIQLDKLLETFGAA